MHLCLAARKKGKTTKRNSQIVLVSYANLRCGTAQNYYSTKQFILLVVLFYFQFSFFLPVV